MLGPLFNWFLSTAVRLSCYGGLAYVVIALVFKIFPKIVLEGLFLNRLCPPLRYLKLDQPEKAYGLRGSRNFRVESASGSSLGVWCIPPSCSAAEPLCDAKKVIVYCHGNAFHRGFFHRVHLYKELSKSGYHVVAFDYSGYGDSTGRPSVKRMIEDVMSVYRWTIAQLKNQDSTIILWGHSLGTHMSTRAVASMCQDSDRMPDCLILEAPFNNCIEASECFPISKIFLTLYPYLRNEIRGTLRHCGSDCPTEDYLSAVGSPVLIMHAEDDSRVNLHLGIKLYDKTISNPAIKSRFIRFVHVQKQYGVAHYTASHPATLKVFFDFVGDVMKFKNQETGIDDKKFELLRI